MTIEYLENKADQYQLENDKQFKKDIKALYRSLSKVDIVTIVIISYFIIRFMVA